MKRYLVTITGRANLGYKGNKLRERDLCCSYVYGKSMAEAISKFWEQIKESSGLKGFERRDFKITAERWEKDVDLDVNGNPLTDLEWAIPFDLLASVEMMHDEHFKNYKLDLPESLHEPQESSEPVAQENIQPELEDATESISEPQRDNRWNVSVFFSKGQILDELFRLKNDLSSGDIVGCTKRHEHQMNRFIKALDIAIDCINEIDELSQKASQSSSEEEKEITQENAEELTEAKPEPQGMAHHTRIKLNYSLSALRSMRAQLARLNRKEYQTNGNTEKCQSLFKKIEAIDEEIARREKDEHI